MGLLNIEKKEDLERAYLTYIEQSKKVREEELKSSRYILAYDFVSKHYWNRQNKKLEAKLFEIVGTYGIEGKMFNMSDEYIKSVRLKRYEKLKSFIDSLTEEQLDSNIFLKRASIFMKTSAEDCPILLNALRERIDNENLSGVIPVECVIPDKTQKYIPEYISTQIAIPYYRPRAYKMEYINVLDSSHQQVYEDYNTCVKRIGKIAEDIYLLQLNKILTTHSSDLMCYYFQIDQSGCNRHFLTTFYEKTVQKDSGNEALIPTEDFIQTTINNFQTLLDTGLIDITVLKERNRNPVLKKIK